MFSCPTSTGLKTFFKIYCIIFTLINIESRCNYNSSFYHFGCKYVTFLVVTIRSPQHEIILNVRGNS